MVRARRNSPAGVQAKVFAELLGHGHLTLFADLGGGQVLEHCLLTRQERKKRGEGGRERCFLGGEEEGEGGGRRRVEGGEGGRGRGRGKGRGGGGRGGGRRRGGGGGGGGRRERGGGRGGRGGGGGGGGEGRLAAGKSGCSRKRNRRLMPLLLQTPGSPSLSERTLLPGAADLLKENRNPCNRSECLKTIEFYRTL